MNSLPPEVLQLLSALPPEGLQLLTGLGGAFAGGFLLVWRIRARLPSLVNELVAVITNAIRFMVREELGELLDAKLKQPIRRITTLEAATARLDQRVTELEPERRTGT